MQGENTTALNIVRGQLRRLRTTAGLSQEDFGRRVHYSGSMVSAIELGQRPLDKPYVARCDEVLDTGGLLAYLLDVAQRDREPTWFRPWRAAEESATQLRYFEPTLIPGLLQTESYARTILLGRSGPAEAEAEKPLAVRMERQAILRREQPPQFVAVIDEAALRHGGEGCQDIMADQLRHLLACAELPDVSVHVVPADAALHIGLSGPFALARSADGVWVGHLGNQLGGVVIDQDDDLAALQARWEAVRNDALPRRQSIELIRGVAESWN